MTRWSLWVAALLNTKFSFKIQSDLPQGKCFRDESCAKTGWGPEALAGSEEGLKNMLDNKGDICKAFPLNSASAIKIQSSY